MQIDNPETHAEAHDLLMHRMNADMQTINNAANFARQATLAHVADDINTVGYVSEDRDAYTNTFNRAYSIGLEMESLVEGRIKAKAASYEAEMRLLLENANQPRIELPEKNILLG